MSPLNVNQIYRPRLTQRRPINGLWFQGREPPLWGLAPSLKLKALGNCPRIEKLRDLTRVTSPAEVRGGTRTQDFLDLNLAVSPGSCCPHVTASSLFYIWWHDLGKEKKRMLFYTNLIFTIKESCPNARFFMNKFKILKSSTGHNKIQHTFLVGTWILLSP